ncbi:MAG: methylmalonyl-CoA carboxyltransferase, partial [Christensenellaceae bacterium]|nr:methylmalonyl-CoA carboxyltransferase [Christensenellaceae bacterium]
MSEFSNKQAEEQHKLGKLTACERIAKIVDADSFVEMDKYLERSNAVLGYADVSAPGEGVITGWATIEGRPVYVCAQDYTVLKGSMGIAHAAKINKAIDMAAKQGMPVICLWDCGGARVQEGAAALGAVASIMKKLTDVSGVVPTISVVAGGLFGCAAMLSALTDFTIAIEKISAVSIASPMEIASIEGIAVDEQAICGAKVQGEENGNAQFVCADEDAAIVTLKDLLRYLPSNNLEEAPYEVVEDDIARATVADGSDAKALIADIADNGIFLEVSAGYGKEMITGFVTMNGYPAGVVANVPGEKITPKGCRKAARFISILDAYDMPIISLVNNEGVAVSLKAAHCCQLRSMAKLVAAYAEAGAPMVSVITGKAIGE